MTERVRTETVTHQGRIFTLLESVVDCDDGRVEHFEVATKDLDSVAILPVDDAGDAHLVDEYCPALGLRLLGLAKGAVDPGETPEQAAARELAEELSHAGELTELGRFAPLPGYVRLHTTLYLARDLRPTHAHSDDRTTPRPVTLPFAEAVATARSGGFADLRLTTALLLAGAMVGGEAGPGAARR